MANMREIRARIKSVKSTQQITKAMKMVSAAKLRRTESGLAGVRNFAEQSQSILDELLSGSGASFTNRFLAPREEIKRVCYVLFVGSRGLCGVYNHAIVRYAQEVLAAETRPYSLVVCGRWGRDVIAHEGLQVECTFADMSDTPTLDDSLSLSDYLKEKYLNEEVDEIHLIYQHYQSVLQQTPAMLQLLPAKAESKQTESTENDYIFEPDGESLLENLMQLYLNNTVYSTLLEAKVGEQAARMTAMSTATDATTELIDDLSLQLNRVRQAAITTEIAEIVGGANALKTANN